MKTTVIKISETHRVTVGKISITCKISNGELSIRRADGQDEFIFRKSKPEIVKLVGKALIKCAELI